LGLCGNGSSQIVLVQNRSHRSQACSIQWHLLLVDDEINRFPMWLWRAAAGIVMSAASIDGIKVDGTELNLRRSGLTSRMRMMPIFGNNTCFNPEIGTAAGKFNDISVGRFM
jgi:hypothetical protein